MKKAILTKEQIKEKILTAIEKSPYKKDFQSVSLFGSYAYGKPTEKSDVDILADFEESPSLLNLISLENDFSGEIGIKVHLITKNSLNEFLKKEIQNKAEIVYVSR